MSTGKKWKMTKKQLHRNPIHKWDKTYKIGETLHSPKYKFKFFRNKSYFKYLSGRVSMRWAMVRNCWYWD